MMAIIAMAIMIRELVANFVKICLANDVTLREV